MTDSLSIEDARDLVASGDIVLSEYREHYKTTYGEESKLTDDQLLEVVRKEDDERDPEVWAQLMKNAELGSM